MTDAAVTPAQNELLRGPYTSLQGLIANQRIARSIVLTPRHKATRQLAGAHRSRLKGRGMEFDDVRGYQPGDDVRNIDWRVTARTTVAHTKTFTEERERPVFIFCDQRPNMFFGSRQRFKSVQAANLASLLAWSALKRKDRVGGLLLGASQTREFRARSSHRAVLTLLAGLDQLNHQLQAAVPADGAAQPLGDALAELRRITKTGSTIFVLSDFHDLDQGGIRQLYELSRHNSVTALAIYDQLERQLPPAGVYRVGDGHGSAQLNTADQRARKRYTQAALQRAQQLHTDLGRLGIPLIDVATTDDAATALAQLFEGSPRRHSVA